MLELASGVVDLHYHAGADLYRRRHSVLEAGRRYAAHDGWVVAKSHLGSTASVAWEARQEGLPVSGSLTLNHIGGGLETRTIERAVYQHGDDGPARLVVYLPTLVGSRHASALDRVPFHPLLDVAGLRGLRVTDESGQLTPAVWEVLRAARDLPVVLATGHASRDEVFRIVDAALECGLDRLLLTHPTHPMCGLTTPDIESLAGTTQVHLELTGLTRLLGHHDGARFTEILWSHPRLVVSSDLGQPDQPDIDEWLRTSARWFAEAGLTARQIRELTVETPSRLLAV
ncbi:DUF6282 family protein [Amycolatopsis sp. H20-H5]|uniref:DUF6282 family protein n=1 Tax=Amycolatopsis sp. H20-H5 TaxID=3046309 RepID=UPI002DBC491D|nr:DUF6282 family protein [Amycolatopsis sp. H20-H5]MEC3980941.1 DUF6282 family protein [Amycolatopsis sp. H20-H5]